ncbi:MAG: RNA polymerase sigma factor [Saprospiraceae bacterium]|nr:RNA polymerase sigma factor [Saprospiraceae bacterium]MDW8229249.1 RNA polymerase sigma factor [Saprospiraceae bacterium]
MNIAWALDFSEGDFLAALARQERWAQQALYEQHYGKMMGICLRYASSRDEALDLLHESFIKIFQNIHRYQPETSLGGWMRTIVINTCIDYHRRNARRRTEDLEEAQTFSAGEPDALSRLSEQEILDAIQRLSPVYRAVFNLYVVEGYSHKEIAEALQITESTSRSNLLKARLKLQEYLSGRQIAADAEHAAGQTTSETS